MNILQNIFIDYYEEIKYTLHPRDTEMENIDKMINCGSPSFGGAMYTCPHCGNMQFVSFRCKSRFCPSCGVKYSQERSTNMTFKLVRCTTVIVSLPLTKNPDFFLEDRFHAKPSLSGPDTVIRYISCYLGRPVITLNRIDSYDRESVTFQYNRHEDNVFVRKNLPAIDFIKLLIRHIPEKHFKMTRYYGLYARHRSIDHKLFKAVHPSRHRFIKTFTKWRMDILLSFEYDPLECPDCRSIMEIIDICFQLQLVTKL